MKVQRMCKKLVLLLLLAALLCQTALAVDSEFLYGQRDISWIGMEGDSFLKLDGNAADRNHPSAAPGYWLDVYIPLVVDISSDCVLQDVTVEALEPESSYEYNQWPYSIRDFEADCAKFRHGLARTDALLGRSAEYGFQDPCSKRHTVRHLQSLL